jgi:hypothetical protein
MNELFPRIDTLDVMNILHNWRRSGDWKAIEVLRYRIEITAQMYRLFKASRSKFIYGQQILTPAHPQVPTSDTHARVSWSKLTSYVVDLGHFGGRKFY